MERGEHGRIRPDAERQRDDRDDRYERGLEERTERELEAAHGVLDGRRAEEVYVIISAHIKPRNWKHQPGATKK